MKKHVLEYFITPKDDAKMVRNMEFGPTSLTESIESSDPDYFVIQTDVCKFIGDNQYCNIKDLDVFLLL